MLCVVCRDGLITTTHSDSGHLMSTCKDLTGTLTPLHDLAVNTSPTAALAAAGAAERAAAGAAVSGGDPGSACVVAAAWLNRLLVLRVPWKAAAGQVVCSYQCPQVRGGVWGGFWQASGSVGSAGGLAGGWEGGWGLVSWCRTQQRHVTGGRGLVMLTSHAHSPTCAPADSHIPHLQFEQGWGKAFWSVVVRLSL